MQICDGAKTKNDLLTEATDQYKEMYMRARQEFGRVMAVGDEQYLVVRNVS